MRDLPRLQGFSLPLDLELVSWPPSPDASPRAALAAPEHADAASDEALLMEVAALLGDLVEDEAPLALQRRGRVVSADLAVGDRPGDFVEEAGENIIELYEEKSWLGVPAQQVVAVNLAGVDEPQENLEQPWDSEVLYESKNWLAPEAALEAAPRFQVCGGDRIL